MKKYFSLLLLLSTLNGSLFSDCHSGSFVFNIKNHILKQFYLKQFASPILESFLDQKTLKITPENLKKNSSFINPTIEIQEREDVESGTEGRIRKQYGRALLEAFSFMAISAALYWWRWGLWAEDWQYSFSWEEQKIRFFSLEATRFDSNSFMTNFSHGPNGAIFYNFARTNHLNVAESYLYAVSTSLVWEYLVEYKEIVSINDNLFNSFLGFSMGEPLFQLGNYLSHREESVSKVLAVIANPLLALNNWLSGKNRQRDNTLVGKSHLESYLVIGPVHGDFSGSKSSYNHFHLGLSSSLTTIQGYDEAGTNQRKLKHSFYSEVYADMYLGAKTIENFNLITKATLFGYYKKMIKEEPSGLKGYQFYLGLASAFDMFRKTSLAPYDTITSGSSHSENIPITTPTEFSDKMAVINTLGPMFELTCFLGKTTCRFNMEAYFDFAMVNSLALTEFSEDNPLYVLKSTLRKYGYYYAIGFTVMARFRLKRDPIILESLIKYHRFDSIEGLDRFQDSIEDDLNLIDSRLLIHISTGFHIPQTPVTLSLTYQSINREGSLEDLYRSEIEKKFYVQIKLELI